MKVNINTQPLAPQQLPNTYTVEIEGIEYTVENYPALTHLHYEHGWRDLVTPEIDHTTEKLGELIYDEANDVGTYEVLQKTEQEIQSEILQQAESLQAEAVQNLLKQKLIQEMQLEEDDETILQNQEAYPIWGADGETQKAGTKTRHFNTNNELVTYRCNQDIARTEQFTPRLAIYAYDEIVMGGDYPIWQQPQAHNPYGIGDIVWYVNEGDTLYISTIDNNVHAPGVVQGAWEIYEI